MLGSGTRATIGGSGCLLLLLLAAHAPAQPATELPAAESAETSTGKSQGQSKEAPAGESADSRPGAADVQEVDLTIISLRDEDGRLHYAPDMTLEELHELHRLRKEERDPVREPLFHFSEAKSTGSADQEKVSLQLTYGIVVHSTNWVRVPLRLGGAVIVESEFEGRGNHFIEYDEEQEGYFAWIKPEDADETHRVKLKILAPISTIGNEHRIELKLPRAVSTRDTPTMTLRVPTANAVGSAQAGAQACPLETKHLGTETEFRITQPGGDFSFVWRTTPRDTEGPTPVTFDTSAKTIVKWDSQSRIVWDTTITVQVLQGELAKIPVRLPPSATLLAQDVPGQRVIAEETDPSDQKRSVVTVEIDRPIAKGQSRDVRLRCERIVAPREGARPAPVEISGFDVEGAARQSGFIGIITAPAWRAEITLGDNVFRQYEMPDGFREAGVLGTNTFQFLAQPYSVKMAVMPRERKLAASPIYVLRVSEGKLSLTAHLKYRVTGAQIDACRTVFPGWDVNNIELADSKDNQSIAFDPPADSTLDIPLPRSMRGEFELRITASQDMPTDAQYFVVNLPSVEADDVDTPQLIVLPDDNIELTFDSQRSSGVDVSDAKLPLEVPEGQQPARLFRLNDEAAASFAAEFMLHPRELSVRSEAEVVVNRSSFSVEQYIRYDVRYGPLETAHLAVPEWLTENKSLQLAIDGRPYQGELLPLEIEDDTAHLSIPLPEPRIGEFAFQVTYAVELSELSPGKATASPVTFAVPVAERLKMESSQLTIHAAEPIRIELDDPTWQKLASPSGNNAGPLRLAADGIPARVDLLATFVEQTEPRSTVVERMWIQSWITTHERQDRAVLQIRTNRNSVTAALPASASPGEMMVLIDERPVPVEVNEDRQMEVALSREDRSGSGFQRYVLEFGWRRDYSLGPWSRIRLDAPRIVDAWTQQVRWQILLPKDTLLLFPPSGMAPETEGLPWWWVQRPRPNQRELERWSGASSQPSPESTEQAAAQRAYAFATVGHPSEVATLSFSAALAMLLAGAAALAIGAVIVYVPQVRHPSVLLMGGVLLACAAIRWPSAALFAGQMAGLVLAATLLSHVLQRLILGRRIRRGRRRAAEASDRRARSSVRLRTDAGLPTAPSTTAHSGPSLPLSPSEAK